MSYGLHGAFSRHRSGRVDAEQGLFGPPWEQEEEPLRGHRSFWHDAVRQKPTNSARVSGGVV